MNSQQCLLDAIRWRIKEKLEAGHSQVYIYRDFNIMPRVVANLWKQFSDKGSIQRKLVRSGRRAKTLKDDLYLSITVRNKRNGTISQLAVTSVRPQKSEFRDYCFQKVICYITYCLRLARFCKKESF